MKKATLKCIRQSSMAATAIAAFAGTLSSAAVGLADPGFNIGADVTTVNTRVGTLDNKLPRGFSLRLVAHGEDTIENPSGLMTQFGLLPNGTRTEPDENTYLVLEQNPGGPAAGYDYGRHFLFQGHENGGGFAYVTRINLVVTDLLHRITLPTPQVDPNTNKTGFSSIERFDLEFAYQNAALHPGSQRRWRPCRMERITNRPA